MFYCPKCQRTYEDGTQRFCVNDGVRLQPESARQKQNQTGGIFSGILNQTVSSGKTNGESKSAPQNEEDSFFELEIPLMRGETGLDSESEKKPESERSQPKPFSKLIRPNEIPSGTAPIGDRTLNPAGRLAFTPENPNILLGQTVKGRYFIKERIRQDETDISYIGKDKLNADRKVVVRIFTGKLSGSDFSSKVFSHERVALSHINHPNVVKLIDSGELPEGNPFIVSEYVKGISLGESLERKNQFNVLRTARIIRQAAHALYEAHQNAVVHRNLNPDNIILSVSEAGTEQVKISGFSVFSDKPKNDLGYQSAEQLAGKPVTFAGDMYSLAVIAYQMLTGRLPFNGATKKDLLKAQRDGLRLYPTNLRIDVPSAADEILDKAFSNDPTERFPKIRDFGDAFYDALTSETTDFEENEFSEDAIDISSVLDERADAQTGTDEVFEVETPLDSEVSFLEDEPAETTDEDEVLLLDEIDAPQIERETVDGFCFGGRNKNRNSAVGKTLHRTAGQRQSKLDDAFGGGRFAFIFGCRRNLLLFCECSGQTGI